MKYAAAAPPRRTVKGCSRADCPLARWNMITASSTQIIEYDVNPSSPFVVNSSISLL